MTSPAGNGTSPAPNPAVLARTGAPDDGRAAEQAIDAALAGLDGLRELPVAEHVGRFEAVHAALTDALGKAEDMIAGSSSSRS